MDKCSYAFALGYYDIDERKHAHMSAEAITLPPSVVDPAKLRPAVRYLAAVAAVFALAGACDKASGGFGIGIDKGGYSSDERDWGARTWEIPRDPEAWNSIVIAPAIGGLIVEELEAR